METIQMIKEQLYYTGAKAAEQYSKEVELNEDVAIPRGRAIAFQSIANIGRTFVGHDTDLSVKSEYNRNDYKYFRPGENIPTEQLAIIAMSMDAYDKVGIINNIIDLMADFASQGIRFQHPRKTTENFYNTWFSDKINGCEISVKYLTNLLSSGNVIVKRNNGNIPVINEREWKRTIANDINLENIKFESRKIPLKYNFINPLSVEILGGELASFIGKPPIALKIPLKIRSEIKRASLITDPVKRRAIEQILKKIPKDILAALKSGASVVPMDMDKIHMAHYRKKDWQTWANPIVYPVLNVLIMLEKMKLADISALDGAISNIRLWKLGHLDGANSILPSRSTLNKLRNILANNVGGGVMDLVWGPELSFTESNTQVWRFLGSEKYEATLNAIYERFGIPPTLRSKSNASNTGSYIGLNTLIKRLQYIRNMLVSFWKFEVALIHKAMGFKGNVPRIIFDNMVLADEAAEKQLLLNMWDRDIISTESIQEIFGRIPEIESSRIKKESVERGEDMPEKASPFHNPDKKHELHKLILQGGEVAPSEVGVELNPRKPGEKSKMEKMQEIQIKVNKSKAPVTTTNKTGVPGRPTNIIETKKRKQKPTDKPSTNASLSRVIVWAHRTLNVIDKKISKSLLHSMGKNNKRSLTKQEYSLFEYIKFAVLCSLHPFDEVSNETVYNALKNRVKPDNDIVSTYNDLLEGLCSIPTVDENRMLFAESYAINKYFYNEN